MKLQLPENIEKIVPYPPGKPQDELEREYGITDSIKLASNENPFSPSPAIVEAIVRAIPRLNRYPDGSSYYLTKALAEKHGVKSTEIVLGNGSDDVIDCLVKAFVTPGDEVISSLPSFLMYTKSVQVRGGVNRIVPLKNMRHDLKGVLEAINEKTRLIFIDNPNNPTGSVIESTELQNFLDGVPERVVVVLDEAYADFMSEKYRLDILSLIREKEGNAPVVFLRTFSKAYGLPGLRVGYGIMHEKIATNLHKVRQPFNMNILAQVAAVAALNDTTTYQKMLENNKEGIAFLTKSLEEIGCKVYPTETNFILVEINGDANTLYEAMLYEGVIVRSMYSYSLPNCIRITSGTDQENSRCVTAMKKCLVEKGMV